MSKNASRSNVGMSRIRAEMACGKVPTSLNEGPFKSYSLTRLSVFFVNHLTNLKRPDIFQYGRLETGGLQND